MSYVTVSWTYACRYHRLLRLLLLVLSLSVLSEAQTLGLEDAQLTATILSQRDCRTDAEFHSVFLGLRLQLLNNATLPVEVAFPLGGVLIISRTLADAKAGRHEFELHGAELLRPPEPGTAPKVEYRLLPPGQSIESVSNNVQLVPTRGSEGDGLRAGKHYLQIRIDGSFRNPEPAGTEPIFRRITSAPIPFHVERYPVPVDCSEVLDSPPNVRMSHD